MIDLTPDRYEIKLNKLAIQDTVSNYALMQSPDHAMHAIVQTLVGTFIRQLQHSDHITWSISYPTSWWQHFKQDVMPKWFVKRYPVKLKTETYEYVADLSLVKVADYQMLEACGPNPIYVQLRRRDPALPDYAGGPSFEAGKRTSYKVAYS